MRSIKQQIDFIGRLLTQRERHYNDLLRGHGPWEAGSEIYNEIELLRSVLYLVYQVYQEVGDVAPTPGMVKKVDPDPDVV